MNTSREDFSWAAGIIDGEGCIRYSLRGKHKIAKPTLTIAQVDPEILYKIQRIFSFGEVVGPYGPYKGENNKRPYYRYQIQTVEKIQLVADWVWPWLGTVKKEQFSSTLLTVQQTKNNYDMTAPRKITNQELEHIKKIAVPGRGGNTVQLAKEFGVDRSTIARLVKLKLQGAN